MRNKVVILLFSIAMAISLAACSGENVKESISLKNDKTMEVSNEKTLISKEQNDPKENEITVKDSEDVSIDTEGTYIICGTSKETCIFVDAEDDDEVNIVLSGLSITNENKPCIFVKNAGKVNISLNGENNSLSVTGEFVTIDNIETDAVIFSKDDTEIGGTGILSIMSTDNCITSKDSLIINGGEYVMECDGNALEAHDMIEVYDGSIDIEKCNDGIHAEDNDDDSVGSVYIANGNIKITASDDAIHATTTLRIDSGTLKLNAAEGLEATDIQINGGDIDIEASDDGINAASKSSAYKVVFKLNDGNVTINMAAGDTDGIDSNGDLYINGGTINITGQSAFDYDGEAVKNGGTIIVNGSQTDTISNQEFGGMKGNFERNDMSEDDRMMGPMGIPQGEAPQGDVPQGERPQIKVRGKRQ